MMTEALDDGPFFHGTIAEIRVGDLLTAGRQSNYRPDVVMNHIYFTARVDGAGLAAEIAAELAEGVAVPHVYVWRKRLIALPPNERGEIIN